jgi:hypothetical protein
MRRVRGNEKVITATQMGIGWPSTPVHEMEVAKAKGRFAGNEPKLRLALTPSWSRYSRRAHNADSR